MWLIKHIRPLIPDKLFLVCIFASIAKFVTTEVLPGPDKRSRPHSQKNRGNFLIFHGHIKKNLPLHNFSKHNMKNKKRYVGGGIF
jgi:hypothetical protein